MIVMYTLPEVVASVAGFTNHLTPHKNFFPFDNNSSVMETNVVHNVMKAVN